MPARVAPAQPSIRNSSSRESSCWTRGLDTSIEMKFPMHVMHVSEFLRLTELESHQALRDAGKLCTWTPRMKHIMFLSHQWTSYKHPDPSLEQLKVVQRVLLRMMAGDVPATAPGFADAAYLPKGHSISPEEWTKIVPDAYIWMEYVEEPCPILMRSRHCPARSHSDARFAGSYFSVPQIGEIDSSDISDMKDAISSIPAYVERCSHCASPTLKALAPTRLNCVSARFAVLAVVPTLRHHDLPEVTCDYGTWLGRGWCRLELWALLLARFSSRPAIIVKGGAAAPFMIACQAAIARPPGCGSFSTPLHRPAHHVRTRIRIQSQRFLSASQLAAPADTGCPTRTAS